MKKLTSTFMFAAMFAAALWMNAWPALAFEGLTPVIVQNGQVSLDVVPNTLGGTGDDTSSDTGVAIIDSGNWTYPAQLTAAKGGTGQDTSASTGVPSVSSGTWSINSTLSAALGGTGADTSASTGVPVINSGTWTVEGPLSTAKGGTGSGTQTGNRCARFDGSGNIVAASADCTAGDSDTSVPATIGFSTGGPVTATNTVYVWPGLPDPTAAMVEAPSPAATYRNLRCRASTNIAAGTVTVEFGVGTCGAVSYGGGATTCSMTAAQECSDTSNTTAATAGQCVGIRVVSGSGATTAGVACTFERTA